MADGGVMPRPRAGQPVSRGRSYVIAYVKSLIIFFLNISGVGFRFVLFRFVDLFLFCFRVPDRPAQLEL